jgi:hypothetical protein
MKNVQARYVQTLKKHKNGNSNAKINVAYEIKRDLYTRNDPTNVKQVSKNLKLLKRILRKRKIFVLTFYLFSRINFYLLN